MNTILISFLFFLSQIKPLHDSYQNEIATTLWEPLNMFWAECYEACKTASQKRAALQLESRRRFQVNYFSYIHIT